MPDINPKTNPLGIENLKKLLKVSLNTGLELAGDLKDKKMSFGETINLIDNVFDTIGVVKTWNQIEAELSDLTEEETVALEAFAMQEFNIPNEKVKTFVHHALMHVVSLYALVNEFKLLHAA